MVAGIGFVALSAGFKYYDDKRCVKIFDKIKSYDGLEIYYDPVENDGRDERDIEHNIVAYYKDTNNVYQFVGGLSVYMFNKNTPKAFQVSNVYTKRLYRGLGIPVLLYETAVLNMGMSVVSGATQSHFSPSIWRDLHRRKRVKIGAFNKYRINNILDVDVDVDRLDCYEMPMYDTDKDQFGSENCLFLAYKDN